MKKFFIIIVSFLLLVGCRKTEVKELFDGAPEERASERLAELQNNLVNATNGWKGELTTSLSGAYSFYFKFKSNNTVEMLSDINEQSSSIIKESTYRTKWVMDASLIFDTFNYITLLQDPGVKVPGAGGTPADGLRSDIEFEYLYSNQDSIVLRGKRHKNPLILTKVTAAEEKAFKEEGLKTGIAKSKQFFLTNANPYFEVGGTKVAIALDNNMKLSTITYLEGQTAQGGGTKMYFDLNGVGFLPHLDVKGEKIYRLNFENNELYALSVSGQKIKVINSPTPILPLHMLMGVTYNSMRSPHLTYYPGTSTAGLTILKRYHEGLGNGATGYIFNSGYIDIVWNTVNNRVLINGFSSQNGGTSGWTTQYVYNYTKDEGTGVYTLTYVSGPSGGYVGAILDQFINFINTSKIKLDYYSEGGNLYGQIIGVDKPEVILSFQLR